MKRKSKAPMLIADLARLMCDERGVRASTAIQHQMTCRTFGRFLGRPGTVADLNVETFNKFVTWLRAELKSSYTAHSRRKMLLTAWNYAAQMGLTEVEPVVRRLARVKMHQLQPRCWTLEQIAHLLAVAKTDDRRFYLYRGIRWSEFWRAFILVGYGSGLRLGDLMHLECGQVLDDGRIFCVMRKTSVEIIARVRPEAVAAVRDIERAPRPRLFGSLVGKEKLYREFRFLLAKAKLPGSIKWLRRSGATWVEVATPGAATAFLGHRSPGIAAKHYIDRRFVEDAKPMPPALPIGG